MLLRTKALFHFHLPTFRAPLNKRHGRCEKTNRQDLPMAHVHEGGPPQGHGGCPCQAKGPAAVLSRGKIYGRYKVARLYVNILRRYDAYYCVDKQQGCHEQNSIHGPRWTQVLPEVSVFLLIQKLPLLSDVTASASVSCSTTGIVIMGFMAAMGEVGLTRTTLSNIARGASRTRKSNRCPCSL